MDYVEIKLALKLFNKEYSLLLDRFNDVLSEQKLLVDAYGTVYPRAFNENYNGIYFEYNMNGKSHNIGADSLEKIKCYILRLRTDLEFINDVDDKEIRSYYWSIYKNKQELKQTMKAIKGVCANLDDNNYQSRGVSKHINYKINILYMTCVRIYKTINCEYNKSSGCYGLVIFNNIINKLIMRGWIDEIMNDDKEKDNKYNEFIRMNSKIKSDSKLDVEQLDKIGVDFASTPDRYPLKSPFFKLDGYISEELFKHHEKLRNRNDRISIRVKGADFNLCNYKRNGESEINRMQLLSYKLRRELRVLNKFVCYDGLLQVMKSGFHSNSWIYLKGNEAKSDKISKDISSTLSVFEKNKAIIVGRSIYLKRLINSNPFDVWIESSVIGYPALAVVMMYVYGGSYILHSFGIDEFRVLYGYVVQQDMINASLTSPFYYLSLIIILFVYFMLVKPFIITRYYDLNSNVINGFVRNAPRILTQVSIYMIIISSVILCVIIQKHIYGNGEVYIYSKEDHLYKSNFVLNDYVLVQPICDKPECIRGEVNKKWMHIRNIKCIGSDKGEFCSKSSNKINVNILKTTGDGFYAKYSQCYRDASVGVKNTMLFEVYFKNGEHNIISGFEYRYTADGESWPIDMSFHQDKVNRYNQEELLEVIKSEYIKVIGNFNVEDDYLYLMSGHTSIDKAHMINTQLSHDRIDFLITKFLHPHVVKMDTSIPMGDIYPDHYKRVLQSKEKQQAVIIVACKYGDDSPLDIVGK